MTSDAPRISAPASLVFSNLLDVHSWHTWSVSIVNAKVANRADPTSGMDELTLRILQKIPREKHEDPTTFDLVHTALEPGNEVVLTTTEDPWQPEQKSTLKLVVLDLSYPLTRPERKKISMLPVPQASRLPPGVANLRQRKRSQQQPSTGPGYLQETQTQQRPSSPEAELADQFPTSYIIKYSVESVAPKVRTSSFGRWLSTAPFTQRRTSPTTTMVYTHIITPLSPDICQLVTTSVQMSQSKQFDYRECFQFNPRRLSEPVPHSTEFDSSFANKSQAATAITRVIGPISNAFFPTSTTSSPPPLWVQNLPRELGGHAVRCFSARKLNPKLAERFHQRSRQLSSVSNHRERYHSSDTSDSSSGSSTMVNSREIAVNDRLDPLSQIPTHSTPSLTENPSFPGLPRSDSSAVDLSIIAQQGLGFGEDQEDADTASGKKEGVVFAF